MVVAVPEAVERLLSVDVAMEIAGSSQITWS
jgi:hypothetical protein